MTSTLNVAGHDDLFVIGDLALYLDSQSEPLPGLAPVAIQQGAFVAARLIDRVSGRPASNATFQYHDRGTMATIGRAAAIAQIGKRQLCGVVAWLMSLIIHLMQIVEFQYRLLVFFQRGWNYQTFGRSARLISGEERVVIVQYQPAAPEAVRRESESDPNE